MGWAMLSKSLIQFSLHGWGCIPSLLFDLRPNYGGGNEDNDDFLQKVLCTHCALSALTLQQTTADPRLLWGTPGHSLSSLGQSLVGSLLLSPGSWCAQGFICALKETVSPVRWKFCNQIPRASKVKFHGCSQSFCQIPRLGNLLWVLELL